MTVNITFQELCDYIIRDFSGDALIEYYEKDQKAILTKQDYLKWIDQLAHYFLEQLAPFPAGAWVGVSCSNSPYLMAILFAVLKCGYPVVLLNEAFSCRQIESYAEHIHMVAVIDDNPERAQGLSIGKVMLQQTILEAVRSAPAPKETVNRWTDRLAFVTSGTTGVSKLYMISAESLLTQTEDLFRYDYVRRATRCEKLKRFLQVLPIRHCFGLGTLLALWKYGSTALFPKHIGVLGLCETIRTEQVDFMASVPAIWKAIFSVVRIQSQSKQVTKQSFQAILGRSLRSGICAGAKMDDSLAQDFQCIEPNILNGWGMTEVGIVMVGLVKEGKSGSFIGRPISEAHVALKLLGEDGSLREDGVGELLIEGPNLYCDMLINDQVFSREPGYFSTGDVFEKRNGCYYFKGRCKGVIINDSGENIYPEELEDLLSETLSDVEQYCVANYNNHPALFLFQQNLDAAGRDALVQRIKLENRKLPPNMRLAGVLISELPMPTTSKGESYRFNLLRYFESHRTYFHKVELQKGTL